MEWISSSADEWHDYNSKYCNLLSVSTNQITVFQIIWPIRNYQKTHTLSDSPNVEVCKVVRLDADWMGQILDKVLLAQLRLFNSFQEHCLWIFIFEYCNILHYIRILSYLCRALIILKGIDDTNSLDIAKVHCSTLIRQIIRVLLVKLSVNSATILTYLNVGPSEVHALSFGFLA